MIALSGHRPVAPPGVLAPFVDAGVLDVADVHVATALCAVVGEDRPLALLATALAARAPRVGHTCLDVDQVALAVADELPPAAADVQVAVGDAVTALPWPDPDSLLAALADSPLLVQVGGQAPLVVEGRRIFLRRQWLQEIAIAGDLRGRVAAGPVKAVDGERVAALVARLFPDSDPEDAQRQAVLRSVQGRLTVLAGGPGTGKTWTVARLLAVLVDVWLSHGEVPEIALAAPTGKAAARLDEGVRDALREMDVPAEVRDVLLSLERGRTIHGLLGRRTSSRFWHDATRPLPHDIVVVDETSMASSALTSHLLDAIRSDAQVILVGDPDQLASVEAGSVLADIVGDPAASRPEVAVLHRPRRFGADSGIGALAGAIRSGDADAAVAALRLRDDLSWIEQDDPGPVAVADVREAVVQRGRSLTAAASRGDLAAATDLLGELVVLCAHRRGRDGVAGWNVRVDRWLAEEVDGWRPAQPWQPGQIVLATTNDRRLGVFNGDLGVVVLVGDAQGNDGEPSVRAVFPGVARPIAPARLDRAEPLHAMTIHKSQGSQWGHVVTVLPNAGSRILTRELLYTAVTRASQRLTVIGTEAVVRAAVARPVRRASGLSARLA